jgi:hypothetical protein
MTTDAFTTLRGGLWSGLTLRLTRGALRVASEGKAARFLCALALLAVTAACATSPAPIYVPGPSTVPGGAGWPTQPGGANLPQGPGVPQILPISSPLQCVPYARERSGVEIYGDAYTWWDQAEGRYARVHRPQVGSVMATRGYQTDTRGHVAFVTTLISERMILVDHANWLNGGEISVNVPVIDVSPDNDWSQIRVWHIPGSHWGGRVYEVQGFILANTVRMANR